MEIEGVKLEFLGHSGFVISNGGGKRIAIDPYNVSEGVGKVDFILITHSHYDHCSIKDITHLSKKGTVIIAPADSQSKITRIEGVQMEVIEVGDELVFGNMRIEAVPAYNIGKDFHPKSEGWLGYVVKLEKVIVYHAGDSDFTPEMKKLSGYGKQGNHFIALLPVSGRYVMTAEEAAKAASLLNPEIAIPMHYGSGVVGTVDDAQNFVKLCDALNVQAKVLGKI
ncbi:MAG TPA: MBL fold metallo-hydrolase [Candidatus Nanoarchaeia archaeon]|nr:MBL fold metallo-hydrolase [Candidatus Nanoarchaeia archaeon]